MDVRQHVSAVVNRNPLQKSSSQTSKYLRETESSPGLFYFNYLDNVVTFSRRIISVHPDSKNSLNVSSSDHVVLQRPRLQKFSGVFDLLRPEAWLAAERCAAQHGAGCNGVSQRLDRVSWLFIYL